MLNITYAPNDADLAERLQRDLSSSGLELDYHFLLVLVSPESTREATVLKAIQDALSEGHKVVPIITRPADLPEAIRHLPPLDLSKGYDFERVRHTIEQFDRDEITRRRRMNWRILAGIVVVVLVIFGVSVAALIDGTVAFPVDEYATENAVRAATINALVEPTLAGALPRSTEDALNFPQTLEAATTRNAPFLRGTATARHEEAQIVTTLEALQPRGTDQAANFEQTLTLAPPALQPLMILTATPAARQAQNAETTAEAPANETSDEASED